MNKKQLVEWGINKFVENSKFEEFVTWVCKDWVNI